MRHILLLGAGFSHNWGGWLAREVAEYLIGCKEVQRNPTIKNALQRHSNSGDFEAALGELQAQYRRTGSKEDKASVEDFQNAVSQMFAAMDKAYSEQDFEFLQNNMEFMIRTFLAQFDAIFTLNQDYLKERHYLNDNVMLCSKGKWGGWQIPGMTRVHNPTATPLDPTPIQWKPDTSGFRVLEKYQPYFKLHGSSNWVTGDGDQLMILGTDKFSQIQGQEILKWSVDRFKEYLSGPVKLMVIGYGYRDDYINQILMDAGSGGQLKLFIIDPFGMQTLDQNNRTRGAGIYVRSNLDTVLAPTLIGASSRRLSETFNSNRAEHAKVMRFFED